MHTWIGSFPQRFPFPLTLFTAAIVYGLALPLHQWVANSQVAVAIIFFLLAAFVYVMLYLFISRLFHVPTQKRIKILGWFDGYVAIVHAIAGIAAGIYALNNSNYAVIPPGLRGYDMYWTYMFTNTLFIFNTAGRANSAGVTAVGVVPGIMATVTGVIYLMIFLSIMVVRETKFPNTKFVEKGRTIIYESKQKHNRAPRGGRGVPVKRY